MPKRKITRLGLATSLKPSRPLMHWMTFCLKYMLLCMIIINQADDMGSLISSKAGLKYTGMCQCWHSVRFSACFGIMTIKRNFESAAPCLHVQLLVGIQCKVL